jgi:hypothetical protein
MAIDRRQFRIALAESGLNTQLEVARLTGINRTRVNGIVNRWLTPRDEEKTAIAAALNVPVDRLFPGPPPTAETTQMSVVEDARH